MTTAFRPNRSNSKVKAGVVHKRRISDEILPISRYVDNFLLRSGFVFGSLVICCCLDFFPEMDFDEVSFLAV